MPSAPHIVLIVSLLLWAGTSLAANMIAAPAKFQVADLSRPVALQVGRVQFQWVGYLEFFLAALALLSLWAETGRVQVLVLVAIAVFAAQRLLILPQLSNLTDQVIAGHMTGGSKLHLIFIGLEAAKLLALLGGAVTALLMPTLLIGRI